MGEKNKTLYYGLAIIILVFLIGAFYTYRQSKIESPGEYKFPSPEKVVAQYFTVWNDKDYPDMYSTFSDGFKKIEPTAKNMEIFRQYVDSQGITFVGIKNIKETSNNGLTASVDYDVVFTTGDNSVIPFNGTFTLKYRKGDVIQGWKLVHPYGERVDES